MNWILFLILFPLLPAVLLLLFRSAALQKWIVIFSSGLICAGAIALAGVYNELWPIKNGIKAVRQLIP